MDGVEMIAAERQRQVDVEGWTPEHDEKHINGEMGRASVCYLFANSMSRPADAPLNEIFWPWDEKWWKPSEDPVRNLVKAGALIAAEIDRIQRSRNLEYHRLETRNKLVAIEELKKLPVSDPEKFMRCVWCGNEMPKCTSGICDDCCPF